MSKIKQIEPHHWAEFLEGFSTRNYGRRARFQVFKGRDAEEETHEANLEEVSLKDEGGSTTVVVTRIARGGSTDNKTHDTITHVRGISVQYDTDNSEDALEITDSENELVMLRMESRVDGVS